MVHDLDQRSPSTKSTLEVLPNRSCPPDASEQDQASQTHLLSLPTETRLLIYHMLFSNLKVMIQPAQSPYRGPDAIIRTCRLCYDESLSVFYKLATVILKHETYLYVLPRKIGLLNMSLVQNMVVCGFDDHISNHFALKLPPLLQKLCIGWKAGTSAYDGGPGWEWPASDDFIRNQLDESCRSALDSTVEALWAKNPSVEIFIEGWVGGPPSAEVCGIQIFLALLAWNVLTREETASDWFLGTSSTQGTTALGHRAGSIVERTAREHMEAWTGREITGSITG